MHWFFLTIKTILGIINDQTEHYIPDIRYFFLFLIIVLKEYKNK